jgi:excisionase family DNA binding protein
MARVCQYNYCFLARVLLNYFAMLEGYLTTKEVAEKLGVSVGRVKQLVAEKRLPAIKIGNTNLVKEEDLSLVEDRLNGRPPKATSKE